MTTTEEFNPHAQVEILHFTDPACPFAFSAEPVRTRLRWHYGTQLRWRTCMIVLTREPGEAERLAEGAPNLQRRYHMPIDPAPLPRPASSEPACLAVVATRIHAPEREDALLRRLRVRAMLGGLLDDPDLIATAARDIGLDPADLIEWAEQPDVQRALEADVVSARTPSDRALALNHKLGGPPTHRRYTAPSYEITRTSDGMTAAVPGFNPIEAYETAIANLAPGLHRKRTPVDVVELLEWAGEPLATAEVALVMGLDIDATRAELSGTARCHPAGADAYWSLDTR
jgi:predicted DsbA family dithiol-disulfide isomerase